MALLTVLILLQTVRASFSAVTSKPAKISAHPWMVLMDIKSDPEYNCNGVIVAPHYVVTSRLCAELTQNIGWMIRSGISFYGAVGSNHQLDRVVNYENPSEPKDSFNLAIVRVKQPFIYGKLRQPIPLSNEADLEKYPKIANLTGWGRLTSDDSHSSALQVLSVKILGDGRCADYGDPRREVCVYKTDNYGRFSGLGRPGSPLVIDGKLFAVGSKYVSNGVGEQITILKKASYYADWIRKNIDYSIDDSVESPGEDTNELMVLLSLKVFSCIAAGQLWQRGVWPAFIPRMALERLAWLI